MYTLPRFSLKMSSNLALPLLRTQIPRRHENIGILWLLERLEGDEYGLDLRILHISSASILISRLDVTKSKTHIRPSQVLPHKRFLRLLEAIEHQRERRRDISLIQQLRDKEEVVCTSVLEG